MGAIMWSRKSDAGDDAADVKATAQVSVAAVKRQSVARELLAYGTIRPSAEGLSLVTLSYDCVVRSISATVGSRVAKGTPLMVVDPSPDARLQFDTARSATTLAGQSLASSRQRYDLRLGTEEDLRVAEQSADDARLKLQSLESRGLGDAARALVSPSDGVVMKIDASPGATVAAGTPIASVSNSDSLSALLGIESSDTSNVRPGEKVTLIAIGRPDAKAVESVVESIGAVTDPATGTLEVKVPLPKGGDWYPGERIEAHFEVERTTGLVVPSSAILAEGRDEVVYTTKGGKAVRHVVQPGIHSGDVVEISHSDLVEGDSVVVLGNYELSDGMDVSLTISGAKGEEAAPMEEKR